VTSVRSSLRSGLFATTLLASLFASGAHADKIYLVGGAVIEGKASRQGDKVSVALAGGAVTLAASSVLRIEPGTTPLERLASRRAALPRGAIAERLILADAYCDEGVRSAERELLQEVLAIDTNHEQARQRLGFVRTERGWVGSEQQLLAQGFVKRGDSWLSPTQAAELARAELQRQTAELTRQKAEAELQTRRVELAIARSNGVQARVPEPVPLYPWISAGYRYPRPFGAAPAAVSPGQPAPFINGVRDPRSYFP